MNGIGVQGYKGAEATEGAEGTEGISGHVCIALLCLRECNACKVMFFIIISKYL